MANVSREEFEHTVAHWRSMAVGRVEVVALDNPADVVIASLVRECRPEEAVHLAGWFEVQAMLADGSHYSRTFFRGTVRFVLYTTRQTDAHDVALTNEALS